MKKLLSTVAIAMFASAVAIPASADVELSANVSFQKDVQIQEDIQKSKSIEITVRSPESMQGDANGGTNGGMTRAAEALAIINATNEGNAVPSDTLGTDGNDGRELEAVIGGNGDGGGESISGNNGITLVNQDVGNNINQANVVANAVVDDEESVAHAQAVGDQRNNGNIEEFQGRIVTEENQRRDDPDRSAAISDSVNGNSGITAVNQNSGSNNNQSNAIALAIGDGSVLALSESMLGQENTGNVAEEITTVKISTIAGSVNGSTGVTVVNQSSGNMNNQGTAISVSGITQLSN